VLLLPASVCEICYMEVLLVDFLRRSLDQRRRFPPRLFLWLRGVIRLTIFGSLGSATVCFLLVVHCRSCGKLNAISRLANVSACYVSISVFGSSCASVLCGFLHSLVSLGVPSRLSVIFDPLERKDTFCDCGFWCEFLSLPFELAVA
jgi:hypothetical protein